MRVVDLLIPPTHIPLPTGLAITEFDEVKLDQVVVGVVLSFKEKRVWQSQPGTEVRKQVTVLSVILQTGPDEVIRVYTPVVQHVAIGQVVQMGVREEWFNGRRVMYADAGGPVVPEGEDPAVSGRAGCPC
jgi:hypothetical protein